MIPSILQYKKRYERSFHKSAITSVAFNSCGSLLAASSLDGLVSVWEVNTGSVLHCINARTPIHSLVWSSEPEGFIFGCENGTLVSVFLEQASIRSTYFHAHSGPIRCLSPHVNTTLLVSGAADQVTVWEREHSTRDESWEVFKTVPQPPDQYSQSGGVVQVTSVNWLYKRGSKEERNRFVVSSYQWHGVLCWDLTSLSIMWRLANPDCSSLALAPDGALMAIYSISHAFEVHDVETHRLAQALPFESASDLVSPPIAFAHDGFAIIGGVRGRACIWDTECGDELQALNHGGACRISTLTTYSSEVADTFLVATGTDEGKTSRIVLWDTAPRAYDSNANGRHQRSIEAKPPPTNQLTWAIVGAAALLLGWGWMG
ncbi:WD40-repeat-containing domain protein [Lactarius psammicola]|nr:WD40-repeat-containing domain protein [Lactarius psammicola]